MKTEHRFFCVLKSLRTFDPYMRMDLEKPAIAPMVRISIRIGWRGWYDFTQSRRIQDMTDLRYPIGKFEMPVAVNETMRMGWIEEIAKAPAAVRAAVAGLSEEQLDTPYRPGGWTVRQVIHHLPDSHMNAYVRFKLALTENEPVVKPYLEERWAELPEAKSAPIDMSVALLQALHKRWEVVLRGLDATDFDRTFRHPSLGLVKLDKSLAIYAWHGRHHVAHITSLRQRLGWD
jgi:hypothetical protein